jgi:broad specificity phosphatase PhoE
LAEATPPTIEAGVAAGWLDGQLSMRGRALAIQLAGGAALIGCGGSASDLGRAVETCSLRLRIRHADPAGHSAA